MNKEFKSYVLVSMGMVFIFAYGVFVGNLEGNNGYISVLVCGIIVFTFLLSQKDALGRNDDGN